MRIDRRLWLNADKTELVEDGDPAAAFLWSIPGREVPDAEAERLGYEPTDPTADTGPEIEEETAETVTFGETEQAEELVEDEPTEDEPTEDEAEPVDLDKYHKGGGWYEYEGENYRRDDLAELLGIEG